MNKINKYTWFPTEPVVESPPKPSEILYSFPKIFIFGFCTLIALILLIFTKVGKLKAWRPYIFKYWAQLALFLCSLRVVCSGNFLKHGVIVSNHISWIDILVIMSRCPAIFVAKSEVRNWPIIGHLSKLVDTIFIERDPKDVKDQVAILHEKVMENKLLILFPEGTSTDGFRVLPFNSSLFQFAFVKNINKPKRLEVQSLTIFYDCDVNLERDFFAWYHSRTLITHIIKVLGNRHKSIIHLDFGAAHNSKNFDDRKKLAKFLFQEVSVNFKKYMCG